MNWTELRAALDRAAQESGREVCRVYCAACGDSRKVAAVRDTAEGFYFEAELPSAVTGIPPQVIARQRQIAKENEKRARFFGVIGVCRYLLEVSPEQQDAPPTAECPSHGVAELEVDQLLAAIGPRPLTRIAKVLIHGSDTAHR